jgi:hypothetical protein
MRLSSLLASLALAVALVSCAPPPVAAPVAPAPPPAPVDALATFGGLQRPPNAEFRLKQAPIGITGLGVIVRVVKAQWTEMDGERDATAVITVQRGEVTKTLFIGEDESRTLLGVRIYVKAAGEVYDEATMRYPAFADVTISAE